MLVYLYTSDYCDEDYPIPLEVVDSPEEEERSVTSPKSVSGEQDEISAEADDSSMLNNVLVYAIAEKYNIKELKQLAKAKFEDQAGSLLSMREFPEIIRELYNSTPSSDRGLRDIVCQVCAAQGRLIVDNPDLNATIVDNGEFGLDLLREVLTYENRRLEKEVARNAKLTEGLKKKEEKVIGLQHEAGVVGKLLGRIGADVEAGKVSTKRFLF